MNLLLLYDADFDGDGVVHLAGARARHARGVLRAKAGDRLRVGHLGGELGTAELLHDDGDTIRFSVVLGEPPPSRAGVDLLLAMPRPKVLKRLLPAIASMGVDRVVLLNAARVEKSYFDSKALARENVTRLFDLGLEQGRDTVRPILEVARRFRPFVEDELDDLAGPSAVRLVAHPSGTDVGFASLGGRPTGEIPHLLLAVGPEGGWVPFELELFKAHAFSTVSLGPRPLRTEIAVPALLGASGRLKRV